MNRITQHETVKPLSRAVLRQFFLEALRESKCSRYRFNGRSVLLLNLDGELALFFDKIIHCTVEAVEENLPELVDRAYAYLTAEPPSILDRYEPSNN